MRSNIHKSILIISIYTGPGEELCVHDRARSVHYVRDRNREYDTNPDITSARFGEI